MIARYSPSVAPAAWLRWFFAGSRAAEGPRNRNLALLGNGGNRHALEFANARQALCVWFEYVRRERGAGEVLLPAQICSVVAESIRRAGLRPRFLDGDGVYPTPSPRQFSDAVGDDTVAVLIAPLYGYLQQDWRILIDRAGELPIMLDLAQGLGLLDSLDPDLLRRADALVYSFGLGKGLDAGGGLLIARDLGGLAIARAGATTHLGVLARSVAVRGAELAGIYRLLLGRLEDASEVAKETRASFVAKAPAPQIHLLWEFKIAAFLDEVHRARARAGELVTLAGMTRDLDAFIDPDAAPLRQIIRLRSSVMRDQVIAALRDAGVDCAAAGEPLPDHAEELYPNAFAFGGDAIRLPFLGRLSDRDFTFVRNTLEATLVRLSN